VRCVCALAVSALSDCLKPAAARIDVYDAEPCGAGTSAHTVVPSSSQRVPQHRDSRATMRSPRPPVVSWLSWPSSGMVGPPPSLTNTRTPPSSSCHQTRICAPFSGLACLRALLSSSLMTTAASPMAASVTPATARSDTRRRRAIPALEGAKGSISMLDLVTSLPGRRAPNRPNPLRAEMPRARASETREPGRYLNGNGECTETSGGTGRCLRHGNVCP
jgi:hypothetical protein